MQREFWDVAVPHPDRGGYMNPYTLESLQNYTPKGKKSQLAVQ